MARHFTNYEQNARIIDDVSITSANLGIAQLNTENTKFDGRIVTINAKEKILFSSNSYLGLDQHPRLKQSAIESIEKFGVQSFASRFEISLGLYRELENLLSLVFKANVLVSPSVKHAHQDNLPVLVGSQDVVIMDAQLNPEAQIASQLLRSRNIPIEIIRHNRLDMLEDRIKELREKYDNIWFLTDTVFSTYGDYAPIKDLLILKNEYQQLHLYIDDSSGMSWTGKNGSGYAKSIIDNDMTNVFIVASLNKAFGAAGCVSIFPNDEVRRKVRNVGPSTPFSDQLSPAILGAALASSEIHLSDEIQTLQNNLQERITLFNKVGRKLELPLISTNNSPIRFIGVGKPGVGYSMIKRLMEKGFYVKLSVFPSVSYNNTGIQIILNNHLTFEDIENILRVIAEELPKALMEEDSSMKHIYQSFKMVG